MKSVFWENKDNNMKPEITKELIFAHFASKATPLQRKQIDYWLQTKANEERYYQWLEEWENKHPEYQPDSEKLTNEYIHYVQSTPRHYADGRVEDNPAKYFWPKRFPLMIAAGILLLLAVGLWLNRDTLSYKNYQTAKGETKAFVLADGSQVTLNARSSLKVPRWNFGQASREVFLTGEANFSVTHTDDDRPFVVKTEKNFEVVVLGTEFSVFARRRGANVILNKGKVQINYQEGNTPKELTMKPGELVTFDGQNQAIIKLAAETPSFSLWREKRFVFEETMLSDVAQMLEETYGVEVQIDSPALARRKLMGSFRADNLDELLQTISDLLNIDVVRQEDTVRLSER